MVCRALGTSAAKSSCAARHSRSIVYRARPEAVAALASFLVKDLLLDWRAGELFFYRRLVDGDPASNNGGWQWAASTGTDAQPWFRIFNPVAQGRKFDPDGAYVRRYVPELAHCEEDFVHAPWNAESPPRGYPAPIVDHAERRAEALRRFEAVAR